MATVGPSGRAGHGEFRMIRRGLERRQCPVRAMFACHQAETSPDFLSLFAAASVSACVCVCVPARVRLLQLRRRTALDGGRAARPGRGEAPGESPLLSSRFPPGHWSASLIRPDTCLLGWPATGVTKKNKNK